MIISDSFVIADWMDPGTHPGRPIAGLHRHRSDDEAWIVLEGRLGFRVGEGEREVAAGESLLVSRGTPHSYWNPAAEPAHYLLVMTPRIHRLIQALHAGDRTDFPGSSRSTIPSFWRSPGSLVEKAHVCFAFSTRLDSCRRVRVASVHSGTIQLGAPASAGVPACTRLRAAALMTLVITMALCGCGGTTPTVRHPRGAAPAGPSARVSPGVVADPAVAGYRVPPLLDAHNVYAADRQGDLSAVVRGFRPLVYVPNSGSDTVEEIDPRTYQVVRQFAVGLLPQHVVPSYDLRTLWVTNDVGNSLTPIDPATGVPGQPVPVDDPYNMYFSPDGRFALVMAERLRRVDFRDAQTMKLHRQLSVPQCAGVNHADFTADGRYMLASCEFAAKMIVVDIPAERVVRTIELPPGASPQDVKLSPDGRVFYVADLIHGGVWMIDATTFRKLGLIRTGAGAHGLYPSRDASLLYVSNRQAGTISVISFASRRVVATWTIRGGGSPDMGGVSASGDVLWLSGRYDASVYAINTRTGRLIRRIPVGNGPHGLCVYPQPGRYSLGHTGVFR